jgi:uncharacterized membrane protein (DUF485 family)
MNQASDATTAGNGEDFDPRQAAELLDQTTRRARNQFLPFSPMLWSYRALVVLVAFGGFWLSARSHPDKPWPTGWALAVALALVAGNLVWTFAVLKRAGNGVSGPAQQKRQSWAAILLVVWIVSYLITTPLYHTGTSHPVWGLYPASAPLMIIGVVAAIGAGLLHDRPMVLICAAIAVIAAAAGFGGPVGAWLILAIGLCAAMLCMVGYKVWDGHRSAV